MNINWNQSGMPMPLVSRLGKRNEFADFKSVLRDAQNQVMTPVDAEAMAHELVQADGREYVEMVRELTSALATAKNDLVAANRRYERLKAALERRGIAIDEDGAQPAEAERSAEVAAEVPAASVTDSDEWDAWNRKFQSLLG